MCQGCVNEGHLRQETYDKLEAFCERFPESEFGVGHIVFGDSNIDDHCLDDTIAWAEAILTNDFSNLDQWMIDLTQEEDPEMLREMVVLLRELRALPEDAR